MLYVGRIYPEIKPKGRKADLRDGGKLIPDDVCHHVGPAKSQANAVSIFEDLIDRKRTM